MIDMPPTDGLGGVCRTGSGPLLDNGSLLITGGTGFVGRWLLTTLSEMVFEKGISQEVLLVTRHEDLVPTLAKSLTSRLSLKAISPLDIRNLNRGEISAVAHLAAYTGIQTLQHGHLTFEADTGILLDISRYLERIGSTPKMLYASSGAVYGRDRRQATPPSEGEHFALPSSLESNAYDATKRASESLVGTMSQSGMCQSTIARLFAFVGPLLPIDKHFAIGNFIRDALSGDNVVVTGSGNDYRSWMYAADMARCLVELWSLATEEPLIVNVGSSESMTIMDAAQKVARLAGVGVSHQWNGGSSSPPTYYYPDTSRLREILPDENETLLEDGIRRHLDWLKARQ